MGLIRNPPQEVGVLGLTLRRSIILGHPTSPLPVCTLSSCPGDLEGLEDGHLPSWGHEKLLLRMALAVGTLWHRKGRS